MKNIEKKKLLNKNNRIIKLIIRCSLEHEILVTVYFKNRKLVVSIF